MDKVNQQIQSAKDTQQKMVRVNQEIRRRRTEPSRRLVLTTIRLEGSVEQLQQVVWAQGRSDQSDWMVDRSHSCH